MQILEAARSLDHGRGLLVFPGQGGRPIGETRLSKLLRSHDIAAVPHGFRSSFRDWAAEATNHPRDVIEAALGHVVTNRTEAAYARSDLFERRRRLMNEWAAYLDSGQGRTAPASLVTPRPPGCAAIRPGSPQFFGAYWMGEMAGSDSASIECRPYLQAYSAIQPTEEVSVTVTP